MPLNTDHLRRCIDALEEASGALRTTAPDDVLYDVFRAACVKEFELILEQDRNETAHGYGEQFAEATLRLLPTFISDARALVDVIEAANDA